MTVDVIIPLGLDEFPHNDSLRILLRSIERNAEGVGRVFVPTHYPSDWFSDEVIVDDIDDVHEHNKDANLIDKTLEVIRRHDVESFVWCADDNVFLERIRLDAIPVIHTDMRTIDYCGDGVWHTRARNTFFWAELRGNPLVYSMESHCPQFFADAKRIYEFMNDECYRESPGLTIMTAFRTAEGISDGEFQRDWKETAESAEKAKRLAFDRVFLGYNDAAFYDGGLRDRLLEMFPDRSRYER